MKIKCFSICKLLEKYKAYSKYSNIPVFCFTFYSPKIMDKVEHFKQVSSESKFALPYMRILYQKTCLMKLPLRKAVVYSETINEMNQCF